MTWDLVAFGSIADILAAEIIGGLLLIIISTLLIKIIYPKKWVEAARDKLRNKIF